jgi:hypothetical protein
MKPIIVTLLAILTIGSAAIYFWIIPPPAPRERDMFIVEATKSVPGPARAEAYDEVDKNLDHLKRGDSLVVAPLTGDAATEAPGKIIRLRLSDKRKAYDADLKQAHLKVQSLLRRMRDDAEANPYLRTDLIGTMKLAAEEKRSADQAHELFTLAVLTDFINDTPGLNFMTHPALAHEESARKFADQLLVGHEKIWQGSRIFLGQLRSEDLKRVKPERRDAIRAFWIEYFKAGGAPEVIFATDGVGQLSDFMHRDQSVR